MFYPYYLTMNIAENFNGRHSSISQNNSGTHKEFFTTKLNERQQKSGIDDVIGSTLTKLQSKLQTQIEGGSNRVTEAPKNLKKVNKKMQLSMAEQEVRNTLEVIRAKECSAVTKDDYDAKRKLLTDKLKHLYEDDYSDDEKLYEELHNIESEAVGTTTKSLVGRSGNQLKPDSKQATELCKQMVQKLNEDKKQRKQRLKQLKQDKEARKEKMHKDLQSRREAKEQEITQKFEEKQNAIRDKIQQRKEKIQTSKSEMRQETKRWVRRSPLHTKIVSEFKEKYELPELEQRKQQLAQIRNFHQPIRLTNIKEHADEKKQLLQKKLQEHFKKREHLAECNKDNKDVYDSKFWKVVKTRETEENLQEQKEKDEVKERHLKKIQYGKNVVNIYKPKVSKKKQLEMTLIKQNLENPHSLKEMRRQTRSVKNSHSKSVMSPTDKGISTTDASSVLRRRKHTFSKVKPLDEKRYSYHIKPHDEYTFVKHDYLTQDRLQKADKGEKLYHLDSWDKDVNRTDLTEEERIAIIKNKSALAEEDMKRKEALMKVSNTNTIDQTKQLDTILLDSIRNKLNFIGEMSQK